jgi:hypothetical protein
LIGRKSPAALSADWRGTLIWRPAKSVVFAGVHQYVALRESLSSTPRWRGRSVALMDVAVARGSGAVGGEHGLDGGGGEVMGEAFCVAAQLLGRGAFPMVGPQHGADVIQVARDAVA